MQINLTGFMESKTKIFMKELWTHLISAQNSPHGIPQEFLERKAQEMRMKNEESGRIAMNMQSRFPNQPNYQNGIRPNFNNNNSNQSANPNLAPIGQNIRAPFMPPTGPPPGPPPTIGEMMRPAGPSAGLGLQNPLLNALKSQKPNLALSLAANPPPTQPVLEHTQKPRGSFHVPMSANQNDSKLSSTNQNSRGRDHRENDSRSRSRSRSRTERDRSRHRDRYRTDEHRRSRHKHSSRRRSRSRSRSGSPVERERKHSRRERKSRSRSRSRDRDRSGRDRERRSKRKHKSSKSGRRKHKSSSRRHRSRDRSRSASRDGSLSPVRETSDGERRDVFQDSPRSDRDAEVPVPDADNLWDRKEDAQVTGERIAQVDMSPANSVHSGGNAQDDVEAMLGI
ncbi:hypothetical protein, variant [Sphaeroforma arctica JP610]|nr:hypothetical protein, variant [Sphaeroforma arctica JP610]KNC79627.1 hypothetical protein, variant [Sphaeroforma arctica JP610]|eukprot:XP_014153529.1 hypothetical protein, variant [Sphaeroforma arctica JP610]